MTDNFHTKTAYEMATELQERLNTLPVTSFADLRAGVTYYYRPSYGNGQQALTVRRMLPSKKMADVSDYGNERVYRITPSRYHGTFRALSDDLLPWLGVTHEQVIDKAITDDLDIPARIRVHYPDKFIQTPERFTVKRLRDVLRPEWGKVMTLAAVDEIIVSHHERVKGLQESRAKAVVLNPDSRLDYDKYIQNCIDDIDFYRWLRPHVDVGGVFYLNGEKP